MTTYARMQDNVVAELLQIDGDIAGRFHPSLRFVDVSSLAVEVGWRQSSNGFEAPAPVPDTLCAPTLAELQAALAALTARVAMLQAQS